jgi:hypothetical protein
MKLPQADGPETSGRRVSEPAGGIPVPDPVTRPSSRGELPPHADRFVG